MDMTLRECVACGASLIGRRSDAVFCSRDHRRWWQYYMDPEMRERRCGWLRGHVKTDEARAKNAAASRRYRAAHPERRRESRIKSASRPEARARKAEVAWRRNANDPALQLAGQRVRMSELPSELHPAVLLIKETRKALRIGRYER